MKRLFLVLGIAAFTFSCHKNTNSSSKNDAPAEDVMQEQVIQTIPSKEKTEEKTIAMSEAKTGTASKEKSSSNSEEKVVATSEEKVAAMPEEKKEAKPEEMAKKVSKTEVVQQSDKKEEINWMSYDEAVKQAKKKPKKIFIDVYTDWCGWCKKMEKTTMKDPKITELMNKKFYAVRLNAESNKEITYQGKKMTEKQLASNIFKITGYPTTVYLESNEELIQPIPGFMDVANLDKILHYIGEDYFKTQSWEQFQMSYK